MKKPEISALEIKVTHLGHRWHAQLILDHAVIDEAACAHKEDVGWICREMLRWHDKLGSTSAFAAAARSRQKGSPKGKVWWGTSMEKIRKPV